MALPDTSDGSKDQIQETREPREKEAQMTEPQHSAPQQPDQHQNQPQPSTNRQSEQSSEHQSLEQQTSQTKEPTQDDKDFDPSAEALIDDIDDERTLEEEEANAELNQAKVQEELDDLKKESEMPIEELLAYYESMRNQEVEQTRQDEEEDFEDEEEFEDDDCSYTSDDSSVEERDWRRSIRVGTEYQADVPEELSEYDNLPPYQTHDTLLWTSHDDLSYTELMDYLKRSSSIHSNTSETILQDNNNKPDLSTQDYFQDEEQLLHLLYQCNYDIEEALRRRALNPCAVLNLWSENECLAFENGLRTYGKDFRQIRENKVPTRTHAELVAFYYLWKKSERHDVYTNRYKLDRKRSLTHPGTTDYMDNFIDDTLKLTNSSASPSTPPINNTNNSTDISVNVELCNDSGLATPSCMLSDSRSPQLNTPNQSQQGSSSISNIQKSILEINQGIERDEGDNHRETNQLDSTGPDKTR